MSSPVLLVHGGLADDTDADRLWTRPGISDGLDTAGFEVAAPDRDTSPSSWRSAADTLAAGTAGVHVVVGGSNGVSVAVRFALQHRHLVERLVLLWPATCGDPVVDAALPADVSHLLAGETLRGVADDELATLDVPVAVMASDPPNPFHAGWTVDRLVALVPHGERIPSFPESPRREFAAVRAAFLETLIAHLR